MEKWIPLEVHANRSGCRKQEPRSMLDCLALNPRVDAISKRVPRVLRRALSQPVFGHGIAEVHDPGLAAEDVQEISDEYRGGDRIRREDNVDLALLNAIQSCRNGSGEPGNPAVGKRSSAEVALAQRQMPLGIEPECPSDIHKRRHLNHLRIFGSL